MKNCLDRITDWEHRAKEARYRAKLRFDAFTSNKAIGKTPENIAPGAPARSDLVTDWIGEIKEAWSRGAGSTIELAKVLSTARSRLRYGQWAELWKSDRLPFSKRKGEMLVVIGLVLGWIDAQTFAHLPTGWSILYHLAQLKRTVFEQCLQQGAIHPKLTLRQAKELVARFKGRSDKHQSRKSNVKQRLQRFVEFVGRTLNDWQPDERELARRTLTRLLAQIDPETCVDIKRIFGWARSSSFQLENSQRLSRVGARLNPTT